MSPAALLLHFQRLIRANTSSEFGPYAGTPARGPGESARFELVQQQQNTNFNLTLPLSQERNFSHPTCSTHWYKVKCRGDLFSIRMDDGQRGKLLFNPLLTWFSKSPSNAALIHHIPKFTFQHTFYPHRLQTPCEMGTATKTSFFPPKMRWM